MFSFPNAGMQMVREDRHRENVGISPVIASFPWTPLCGFHRFLVPLSLLPLQPSPVPFPYLRCAEYLGVALKSLTGNQSLTVPTLRDLFISRIKKNAIAIAMFFCFSATITISGDTNLIMMFVQQAKNANTHVTQGVEGNTR